MSRPQTGSGTFKHKKFSRGQSHELEINATPKAHIMVEVNPKNGRMDFF